MITKKNFVEAIFIDEDRKTIEVLLDLPHTDTKALTPYYVEADENNSDYQDLLKLVTVDQLHENTYNTKREESEAFVELAKQFAKEGGLIQQEENLAKTKMYPTLVEAIFNRDEDEDDLFALKLALFEVEKIRESKNTKLKTKLRKAKSKIEVLRFAFDIVG